VQCYEQTGSTNMAGFKDQGLLSVKELWVDAFIRLQLDSLRESRSLSENPHARWCGEGELEAPLYPIRQITI
jgi:hypothetical protein